MGLPEEFSFVTTDIAPRVNEFRGILRAKEPVILDLQMNLGGEYKGPYSSGVHVVPIYSARECLFFHCAMIREMLAAGHSLDVAAGYQGHVTSYEKFFIGRSSEKSGNLFMALLEERPGTTKRIRGPDGKEIIKSNVPGLAIVDLTPQARQEKEDLRGHAGAIKYTNGKMLLLHRLQFENGGDKDQLAASVVLVARSYIERDAARRSERKARIQGTSSGENAWGVLNWDVRSGSQIVAMPLDGDITIPVMAAQEKAPPQPVSPPPASTTDMPFGQLGLF